MFVIELFPLRHAILIAILSEGVEVSLIMFAGQTRKTALELQMPDKLIYPVVLDLLHSISGLVALQRLRDETAQP